MGGRTVDQIMKWEAGPSDEVGGWTVKWALDQIMKWVVDIRLHGKGNSKLPWRKAGQPRHLVDVEDSDQ